jgi:hypothetical protein
MFIRDSMMARLALLIGIGLVTAGNYAACAFKSGPNGGVYPTVPGTPGTPGTPGVGTFTSDLTLRNVSGVETDSFVFGEPIRFDFEIFNRTNTQQRVQFPDAQTHEFLVANQASAQIVWKWSDGQAFAQVATELVFEPYASKTFTLIWSGTLADGTNLGVGNYQARGALVYPGFEDAPLAANDMASPLEPFTVR